MPQLVERGSRGAAKPAWQIWGLDDSVLREPIPGTNRVVLWLPRGTDRNNAIWERVAPLEVERQIADTGLYAAAATRLRARQCSGGLFRRLFHRPAEPSWVLPNGHQAEQQGDRQMDVLLVWAGDDSRQLDEGMVLPLWPQASGVERLAKNLLLVIGVRQSESSKTQSDPTYTIAMPQLNGPAGINAGDAAAASTAGSGCPVAEAERRAADARALGNPARIATALADLGAVYLNESRAEQAIATLGEALAIARELGDRERQADVLGNLGVVTLAAGHPERALEIFEMELGIGRDLGDPFVQKRALERLGLARSRQGQPGQATAAFAQALALARQVGHRKHEADLLWYLSIAQAEVGERSHAESSAEQAIAIMEAMGNPQAKLFREHLRKYQAGETSAGLAGPSGSMGVPGSGSAVPESIESKLWTAPPGSGDATAPAAGPGLLRMALSVAKSMARYAASGFRAVPLQTIQERLALCSGCEHHTGLRCRLCGCFTGAKARLAHEECPIGKWSGYR